MVEIKDRPISSGLNELEKTFQEYKKKLEHTELEAQQIMDLAWKKADSIFKESQSKAQKMADEIRQAAKAEADRVLADANAKAAEAENMIKEQLSKAQKMADEMMQAAKVNSVTLIGETGRLIDEVSKKAENVLGQFQTRLQSEFAELNTKIEKAKNTPDKQSIMTKNESSTGNDQRTGGDNSRIQRKLMVLQPYTEAQARKLAELLKQIPGIKIDGTAVIEDNFSITISFFETIPINKILSDSSLIESSELKGDIYKLKLRPNKTGNF